MLVLIEDRENLEHLGKNLTKQSRKPSNSIHIWLQGCLSYLGDIGGRLGLSHCGSPSTKGYMMSLRCKKIIIINKTSLLLDCHISRYLLSLLPMRSSVVSTSSPRS